MGELREIKLGECYDDFKLSEGISITFDSTGLSLLATYNAPTFQEVQMYRNDKIEIRMMMYKEKLPYCIVKLGKNQYMDCPLIIDEATDYDLREIEPNKGYALNIILADNRNGMVKSLRLVGLEHDFSEKVRRMIVKHKDSKLSLETTLALIKEIQSNYPTKLLWQRADKYI